MQSNSSSQLKRITVDEFGKTQPIDTFAQILLEIKSINDGVKDLRLDMASINARVNLAGNLAAEANATSEDTLAVVRRIDQNLQGIYELAKTGYDIATSIKKTIDSVPPIQELEFEQEPDSSPEIIIDRTWEVLSR